MDPSERWQPIAPASDEPGQQRFIPDPRKKRQAVAVACLQCRSGKAKCDGTRPRCSRCNELDLACQYDVAEGVSRSERLKLFKRDSMSSKAEEMDRILTFLRTGSDDQASAVLARLRIGDRLDDIAKGLPQFVLSPTVSKPTSSIAQDSASTSGSGANADLALALSESIASPYRHEPQPSYSPVAGQIPTWSGAMPTGLPPLDPTTKEKQPALVTLPNTSPFLSILFNRDDYLRSMSEEGHEDEVIEDAQASIDPRLIMQSTTSHIGGASTASSMDHTSRSQVPSPQKEHFAASHALMHLRNRQPMVNTLRVHSNLNLGNLFGNMPFSSSIRANNYPSHIQDTQVNNLGLPTWAMMTVNSRPDPGSIKTAFHTLHREAAALLGSGTPIEHVIELHPNIAALFDEAEFNRSGILTRWAASMVHSAQLKGNDFTAFASMYVCWYLMRWMISPSPETYEAIPEWLRPTPNQLFMPHISILDFVIWPAFRDFAVQIPELQERMEWMMDLSINLRCDWFLSEDEALQRSEQTGALDLCDAAKTSLRDLTSWSVGLSIRQYITNADSYMRIRTYEY